MKDDEYRYEQQTAALMHNSAHASATGTCGGIWLSVWNAELWNLIVGWISNIMGFDYNSAFSPGAHEGGVPDVHIWHLIRHLAQGLGCSQDLSSLFPRTKLTHFSRFIQYVTQRMLSRISCRCHRHSVRPLHTFNPMQLKSCTLHKYYT